MSRNHFADCFIRENSVVAVYTSAREKTAILRAVSTPISFSAQPIVLRHLQAFKIIIHLFPFSYRNVRALLRGRLKVCFRPAEVKAERAEHPCRQREYGSIHPSLADA